MIYEINVDYEIQYKKSGKTTDRLSKMGWCINMLSLKGSAV